MKCPKCGGEIPFYDIKPNCRHCGVNILYYTQNEDLARDAKRAELESAVARMVIARLKAVTVGSLLAVLRMIFIIGAIGAMAIPFATATYSFPFYRESFSVGLIGLITGFINGLLFDIPDFYKSTMLSDATLGALIVSAFFGLLVIIDFAVFIAFVFGIIKPDKSAKTMKKLSLIGCVISLTALSSAIICNASVVTDTPNAAFTVGFGSLVCFAMHLILVLINSKMLKKGVEPTYREYDPKRRDLLKQVKRGEINLDDLTLPVFESQEEHEARMREFRHAMKEEPDIEDSADSWEEASDE